jgi:hypothetical protein
MYVIPQLVGYNFQTVEMPKLRVRNIGETKDLQQWASAVSNLMSQNGITNDLETEQFLRNIFDLPYKQGDKQTPEANSKPTSAGKAEPNVAQQDAGNMPKPTDNAQP